MTGASAAGCGPEELAWLVGRSVECHQVESFAPPLLTHLAAAANATLAALVVIRGPGAQLIHHVATRRVAPLELSAIKARIEGVAAAEPGEAAIVHRYTGDTVTAGIYLEPAGSWDPDAYELLLAAPLQLLDLVATLERTRDEALHDALTGLANRRLLTESLGASIEQGNRYGSTFSLAILDMDNFKWFNDTYGHAEGDLLLKETARVVRSRIRRADLAARYGGDELMLLLPFTDTDQTRELLLRIQRELEAFLQRYEGGRARLGVSWGTSHFPGDGRDADTLIRRADERLYTNKQRRGITGG